MNRAFLAALIVLAGCNGAQRAADAVASNAPRGAKDAWIAASVKAKLASFDLNTTTNVKVTVRGGNVVLEGKARSEADRGRYESAARSVDGVRGVDDRTAIDPHLSGPRESAADAGLVVRVSAALASETGFNAFSIKPSAKNGTVTLSGSVHSAALKTTMLQTVHKLDGVRAVVDRIAVKP